MQTLIHFKPHVNGKMAPLLKSGSLPKRRGPLWQIKKHRTVPPFFARFVVFCSKKGFNPFCGGAVLPRRPNCYGFTASSLQPSSSLFPLLPSVQKRDLTRLLQRSGPRENWRNSRKNFFKKVRFNGTVAFFFLPPLIMLPLMVGRTHP